MNKYITLTFIALLLTGCGEGQQGKLNTTQLTDIFIFAPNGHRTPLIGESFQLQATGIYNNAGENQDITGQVQWLSSNTGIATVSEKGKINTIKEGLVVINANLDGTTGELKINVTPLPIITHVEIQKTEGGFFLDEKDTLNVTAEGLFSNKTTQYDNSLFSWSSNNQQSATVNQDGTITGVSFGEAIITAISKENPSIRDSILMTINPIVTGISLPNATTYLNTGEKKLLIASFSMSDGSSTFAPTQIQWSYAPNESITKINSIGEVLAQEPEIINATANYLTFTTTHKLVIEPPLEIFTTLDTNKKTTISWNKKLDINTYTLIVNDDFSTGIEFGNDIATHTQIKDSSLPVSFQLISSRINNSTEHSKKIIIFPHESNWQKIVNISPAQFSANTRNKEHMYFIGGEIIEQNSSPRTNEVWRYSLKNNTWSKETPLASPLSHATACSLNNTLYVFGGLNLEEEILDSAHAYNTDTNSWQHNITNLPKPLFNMECITLNEIIYISGGTDKEGISTSVYSYNPAKNTWNHSLPNLNLGRSSHSMISSNNQLYVAGGTTNLELATTQVETLNLNSETSLWVSINAMNHGRSAFSLHKWNNMLHAIGGNDNTGATLNNIEAFDLAQEFWNIQSPMPLANAQYASTIENKTLHLFGGSLNAIEDSEGRSLHMSHEIESNNWSVASHNPLAKKAFTTSSLNNQLFIIGGSYNGQAVNEVSAYDPTNNTWRTIASLPTPIEAATSQAVTGDNNNYIYVFGGSHNRTALKNVRRYSAENNLWENIEGMNKTRAYPSSAKINSKIYIFGGNSSSKTEQTFEIYDTQNQTWTQGSMDRARSHASTAILHGKIYLIGGRINGVATQSVSTYNPLINNWSSTTANLQVAREQAGSVVFNNKIYIIGGVNSAGTPLNTIEVYTGFSAQENEKPTWQASPPRLPSAGGAFNAEIINNKITIISQEKSTAMLENIFYILE